MELNMLFDKDSQANQDHKSTGSGSDDDLVDNENKITSIVKFPINVDDAKSIQNISKTKLVEVIKSSKKDI